MPGELLIRNPLAHLAGQVNRRHAIVLRHRLVQFNHLRYRPTLIRLNLPRVNEVEHDDVGRWALSADLGDLAFHAPRDLVRRAAVDRVVDRGFDKEQINRAAI